MAAIPEVIYFLSLFSTRSSLNLRQNHTQQFGLCTFSVAVMLATSSCSLNECDNVVMLFNISSQQQSAAAVQSSLAEVRVRVCVCGSASSKLCVNDGGEKRLYFDFQRLNQEEYLKNGKASVRSVPYIICLVIWKKRDVNIHISLLVFFFAAIKKMIIFISSFVFYIKTCIYLYVL